MVSTTGDENDAEMARAMCEIFTSDALAATLARRRDGLIPSALPAPAVSLSSVFAAASFASLAHRSTAAAQMFNARRMSPVAAATFREHSSSPASSKTVHGKLPSRWRNRSLS